MDRHDAISPLDYRYYDERLKPYLSENASIRYQLMVEAALARTLAEKKACSKKTADEIEAAARKVTAAEVYEEEQKIKHNVRALTNCIRRNVSEAARPFVHLGATSNDVISTSEALRWKDATIKVLLPELLELEKILIQIAEREKETLQIGRTHGQHAEPVTFGFAMASFVSRLGGRIVAVKNAAENMIGKFSGAVGAYNASSLLVSDPEKLEKAVLEKLGLKPGSVSTQVAEAEYATDLMHAIVSSMGVMANLADDMRHLQRSEIAEVSEKFESAQVGSSTMPHKRNPINFENVKSMWKEFMPRMNSVYMDQISEHQRDLTNSASSRFNAEIIAAAVVSAARLRKVMARLSVDAESLKRNFEKARGMIAAEPAYVLLASKGHPDAHEAVRKLTLEAEKTNKTFQELLFSDEGLKSYLNKVPEKQLEIIRHPENYSGLASQKTEEVCREWKKKLNIK